MDNIQIAQKQYISEWYDNFTTYTRSLLNVIYSLMAKVDALEEEKHVLETIKQMLTGKDAIDVERDLSTGNLKRSTLTKIEKSIKI